MKIKKILTLLFFLFLGVSSVFSQSGSKSAWYTFYFPEKLSAKSPAHIGKIILDPPAGKHGFTTVKDGDFSFQDGTPARFYGISLCFSANFPEKKEAQIMAERLAFFGFNAVRLHHMDFYFEPNGIFKDICPAYKDKRFKKTTKLSEKQLNKLDYLIYQLKQKGIYIDINLLVARHFTEADDVEDAGDLGMAAKPVSMFDPKLIALQKEYARELLTHQNRFTKLKYCDDPAVALIEITNENSLLAAWSHGQLSNLPDYYLKELKNAWNAWLKQKYETIRDLKESWLKDAPLKIEDSKELLNESGNVKSWTKEEQMRARFSAKNAAQQIVLDVTAIDDKPWYLQFKQNEIYLKKDAVYTVSFKAKADKNRSITVAVMQDKKPWENLGLNQTVKIDRNLSPYKFSFASGEEYPNARITFQIGQETGTITLEDVSLKETGEVFDEKTIPEDFAFDLVFYEQRYFYPRQAAQDMTDFLINLEKSYFREMTDFLKNDLMVKVPITGIGGYNEPGDLLAQQPCDFIDAHAYWDHPRFPNKNWDMNDFRINNASLLEDKKLGIIGSLSNRAPFRNLKPYTVTEWNHCYPNPYAYETPALLAAEANRAQWDGLFLFAYSHGRELRTGYNDIHSYFDAISNPQKLLLCAISSYIFNKTSNPKITLYNGYYELDTKQVKGAAGLIKNKTFTFGRFTIESKDNGAIFIFAPGNKSTESSDKIILAAIGEVKNTASFWDKYGKFYWGQAPALLKKMDLTVKIRSPIKPRIYPLDNQGKPAKKDIPGTFNKDSAIFSTRGSDTPWFEVDFSKI